MLPGLPCRPSSRAASGWSSSRGGYAVVEAVLAGAFLVALLAALAGLSLFIARAEARDRREHDTDHDL